DAQARCPLATLRACPAPGIGALAERTRAGGVRSNKMVGQRLNNASVKSSAPYKTRTHITAVKGRCPGPLDEGRGRFMPGACSCRRTGSHFAGTCAKRRDV